MTIKTAGLFLAMTISAVAATYSGTVRDTQGKPVENATVTLYSSASTAGSATTDSTGTYRLEDLTEGDYLLRITAPGFASYVGPQQSAIVMEIAKVHQQVVVTAEGTPQAPEQVSRAIDVIDRSESEARNANALTDALNITAGLRVQQLGGPGGYSTIQIRGLRAQDTAVLVDGMRLRDASATQADASGLIEDLLVTNASQIEVLRGSGSSLYGTDAIGGVVNIITEEGGGRTRGSLLLDGGSLGTERMNARLSGASWKDRIDYSVGVAQTDVTTGIGGDAPFRDISTLGRVTFRLAPSVRLIARLYGADSFSKVRGSADILGSVTGFGIINAVPGVTFRAASDNPDYTRAARLVDAALILKGQATPALDYSLSYQLISSSRRFSDGPAGIDYQPAGSTRSLYDGRIQTANALASYRLSRTNLLSGGYEFEGETYAYDTSQQNNAAVASASNVTERSQSVFVQDQAHLLGDRLQLSAAFRTQHFALDDPSFLPLASAPYRQSSFASPTPAYTFDTSAAYTFRETGTKLRAHVGRGYRAPSLFERFGAGFDPIYGYSVYGDPRLQPERSLGFDAGFDQTFLHNRVQVSASYFYTWLSNIIAFNSSGALNAATDPYGRFIGYVNVGGGISRGLETKVEVAPIRSLKITGAYTYVNALQSVPVVGNVLQTFVVPRDQFSFLATKQITSRLMFTLDTLVSSSYLAPLYGAHTQTYRFGGIHKVNAGVSYRLPLKEYRAIRFFVRAGNIFNQTYFESGFLTPGRTALGGLQYEF